jgi:hypothetical protein
MKKTIVILLAASAFCLFMLTRGGGYTYDKNDLVIPPGVTCQMQVRSWISQGGISGIGDVAADLRALESPEPADALDATLNSLTGDEGKLRQDMPPGCVPGLDSYEDLNVADVAPWADGVSVLYDLRAGKPDAAGLARQEKDAREVSSLMQAAISRLQAYART